MIKKSFLGLIVLIFAFVLFACQEDITLSIDDLAVTLKEGDTYQIEFESNDELINFESSDDQIVTVNNSGLVEAKKDGVATITVSSTKDENLSFDIEVTVEKLVILSVDKNEYTIKVGETEIIQYTSNEDVVFESSDTSILSIDNQGQITGVSDGEAIITITSSVDGTLSETVIVTVRKVIQIDVEKDYYEMWIGKTENILYTSNEDVYFEVDDMTIASVSSSGMITGIKNGMTTIDIISSYDDTVKDTVNVRVYNDAETIIITGQHTVNVNTVVTLNAEIGPDDAYEYVTWSSSDEAVATISAEGVLTALQTGLVTITAISDFDDTLIATFEVEVVNYLIVDETKIAGNTTEYIDMTFEFGVDMFANIQDAIDVATEGATIYVFAGEYEDSIDIHVANISIEGLYEAIINAPVVINANNIEISNIWFLGESTITNAQTIEGFKFNENTIEYITNSTMFMHINGISDLEIKGNTFLNLSGHAIVVENYLGGLINIYDNNISDADTAIKVVAVSDYDSETKLHIERNTISLVNVGIDIQTISSINIEDYVRFNKVDDYNILAAKANENHKVDFTLNYWGSETPVYTNFENITTYDLRGFYSDPTKIISESKFNPNVPVMLIPIENDVELVIGDSYQVEYEALPIGSNGDNIRYITSDPDTLKISNNGTLELLRSGEVVVTLLLGSDFTVNTKINISISTTPGIELSPSVVTNTLLVGDVFTLSAEVFPYAIRNEDVAFESSDIAIATIDQEGLVTSHSSGLVKLTASLISDPTVKTDYMIEIYASLNDQDLMDMLTMSQVHYTTPHEWEAVGMSYNYFDYKYESVSRYYFGDLEVNQSKLLPVSTGLRSGLPMSQLPEGVTSYNDYNVHWIVMHDTANTATGAGALSHANYLWNLYTSGSTPYVSWHFTIDDKLIYQHLPEIERGYHAGDGSTQPTQSLTYLGGGNTNGIGIEMGINDDADVYRTWQRAVKLATGLLVKYDLPRDNMKYHNDFSGKNCPQTLRNAGLIPLFEKFADIEYKIASTYSDAQITLVSNNPEYLDNTGRIISMPDRAMTVSYTITIDLDGIQTSRTFYSYLPGTVH